MNIILVDDHKIFRDGLKMYLEMELGHTIISEAGNGIEFLSLPNIHEADLILMDIEMPEMDGLEATSKILKQYAYLKIIAITMYRDKVYLRGLIEKGIRGFIHKSSAFCQLKSTLTNVAANEYCFPDDLKLN